MDIISLIIVLIVIGLVMWAVNAYLPIAQPIKNVVMLLLVLAACLWLLGSVGVIHLH